MKNGKSVVVGVRFGEADLAVLRREAREFKMRLSALVRARALEWPLPEKVARKPRKPAA